MRTVLAGRSQAAAVKPVARRGVRALIRPVAQAVAGAGISTQSKPSSPSKLVRKVQVSRWWTLCGCYGVKQLHALSAVLSQRSAHSLTAEADQRWVHAADGGAVLLQFICVLQTLQHILNVLGLHHI